MLLFETTRLSIFKKISSLPVFAPTQMKYFPSYSLLSEPTKFGEKFQSILLLELVTNPTKKNKCDLAKYDFIFHIGHI